MLDAFILYIQSCWAMRHVFHRGCSEGTLTSCMYAHILVLKYTDITIHPFLTLGGNLKDISLYFSLMFCTNVSDNKWHFKS